ncbi:hypothetical protein SO802_014711 [Lithocarpus litseifolius]|uniref:Uncharacterized protein n=1 Tax=Lithocarpus litseifolius TaxID=425828 RepID=A0AAW2CRQ0_9ROSI
MASTRVGFKSPSPRSEWLQTSVGGFSSGRVQIAVEDRDRSGWLQIGIGPNVNKVSVDVKDILEKVKGLAEFKKAMKEELSRLQEDLQNTTKDELQSLDSMELEEQIKFQESTAVVVSRDVDFCVKVDDDIHEDASLEVQSKEPTKKIMMIFQELILDAPMEAFIQESMIQELAIQESKI